MLSALFLIIARSDLQYLPYIGVQLSLEFFNIPGEWLTVEKSCILALLELKVTENESEVAYPKVRYAKVNCLLDVLGRTFGL